MYKRIYHSTRCVTLLAILVGVISLFFILGVSLVAAESKPSDYTFAPKIARTSSGGLNLLRVFALDEPRIMTTASHLSPERRDSTSSSPIDDHIQVVKLFEETSYYLQDVDFISTTVGWAVGYPYWDQARKVYTGTIIKTLDGGETWAAQEAGVCETLREVEFVDAGHGWAVGTNGTILHTDDGGEHWARQAVATDDEFRSVVFANAAQGWAAGVQPVHYDHWGDPDNWQASVWHTSDGGDTWLQQSVPISASILNHIEFVDAQTGWAVGVKYIGDDQYGYPEHAAVIYHTADGGATWEEQPYSTQDLDIIFTGVDFVDANNGWVAGFPGYLGMSEGTVFHTSDGGDTWGRQTPRATFWDVQFVDENRGYIVGFDYIGAQGPPVYRTLDGGASWEKTLMKNHDMEGLFGVAVMEDHVIGVGDHDFVATSTDPWGTYEWPWGENLFTQAYINVHYEFEDVFFVDENHGWAVGSRSFIPDHLGQVIFYTADGGLTWETQYEQAPLLDKLFSVFRLDSVYFVDSQTGWATGMSEYDESYDNHWAILNTTDGGLHWEEQGQELAEGLAPEFFAVQFLDSQNGWALDDGHYDPGNNAQSLFLAHTTDAGATWEWVSTGITGSMSVGYAFVQGGLDFTDAQHGWAAGGLGKIIHTDDGGVSWSQQELTCDWPSCPKRLFAIEFINDREGWIAGEGLYHTTDGGEHWAMEDMEIEVDYQDIQFIDPSNGWLAGDYGVILHTMDGGSTWHHVDHDASSVSLRGLSFVNPYRGWLVGDYGAILSVTVPPIAKSVVPTGQVAYGHELTYTLSILAAPGTQMTLYDPLEGTTFKRFLVQPSGINHADGVISGTVTVTPTGQITVSFVAQVGVPGTAGLMVSVTNRACVYPFSGTLGNCIWSNEVTNPAFRFYSVYLPVVVRWQ